MVHDWLDLKCKWMCSFNHYKMRLYNHIQQTQHIGSYEQNHKIASQLLQKCSGLWSQQILLAKDYGLFNKVWKICINESVLNIFSGIWNLFLMYNQALWFSITDTFAITDHGNIYFFNLYKLISYFLTQNKLIYGLGVHCPLRDDIYFTANTKLTGVGNLF